MFNISNNCNMNTIGWIGLGTMGIPMATQLINAGYELIVYNRSIGKADELVASGAKAVESPKAVLENAAVVVLMVSDDAAIRQIFEGDNGLLAADATGKTIINMSTVSPGISVEMAEKCLLKGNGYLDAPVSGSVKQAETAQLVIMAGGNEATFKAVLPVLEKLGKLTLRVGQTGAGNQAKLAINSLLALYTQGLAETVLFANQNGIKTDDLLQLLSQAAIGNVYSKIKGDAILSDNYRAAFALKHIVKDLKLAKDEGLSSPLAKAALETFEGAVEKHGEEDLIAVIKALK